MSEGRVRRAKARREVIRRLDGDKNTTETLQENTAAQYNFFLSPVRVQKRFVLSPRLFSKPTEMIGEVKDVSLVDHVETWSLSL